MDTVYYGIKTFSKTEETKEVQEVDVYVQPGAVIPTYWIAAGIFLSTAFCLIMVALLCWYRKCRDRETYAYTALEPENAVHERPEGDKKVRERAFGVCSQFLKSNPRYKFVDQLNDIGSRVEKHWFIVQDNALQTERLLTFVPRGPNCPVEGNDETKSLMLELLFAFQHPYIYPVLDINFRDAGNRTYAFITIPLNTRGSLKDYIYNTQWEEDWSKKYAQRSSGLPISQVQRLGRQILEALLFLHNKGFPPSGHFHTGNIMLQNGVARLSGLENTLLGYTSRTHAVIWARAKTEPAAVDSLCFGHVLFEMCAGYELETPTPTPGNILDLYDYPRVVEVLEYIFDNPRMRLPTIEELLVCDLFRNIDLREIQNQAHTTPIFRAHITERGIELLNEVKRVQYGQLMRMNAQTAQPNFDPNAPSTSQQDNSGAGANTEEDAAEGDNEDANSDDDKPPVASSCNPESAIHRDTPISEHIQSGPLVSGKEHRCLTLHKDSKNRVMNAQGEEDPQTPDLSTEEAAEE